MPSELTKNVQDAISKFIKHQTSTSSSSNNHGPGYVAIDVIRAIKEEATLMMEYQTICDTFDLDPLNFYDDDENDHIRMQVDRIVKVKIKIIETLDT
jgi:hypothetical protein